MDNLRELVSVEDAGQSQEESTLQARRDEYEEARQRWLSEPFTRSLIIELESIQKDFLLSASSIAYNKNTVLDSQLIKAETLRKVVEYARSGKTNW